MNEYTYPDPGDRITCTLINEHEKDRDGYWSLSESKALDSIIDRLKYSPRASSMLDIGCGDGRLFEVFSQYFETVTGIEPDVERYRLAVERVSKHHDASKFQIYNLTFLEFNGGNYDFILCSHILQHLPGGELLPFLRKMASMTNPGGIVSITTNHSVWGEDKYFKAESEYVRVIETEIDQIEYEHLTHGRGGILPIRFYHPGTLISILEELGMELLDYYVFHVAPENHRNKPLKSRHRRPCQFIG